MYELILVNSGAYHLLYMVCSKYFAGMFGTVSLSGLLDISEDKFKKIIKNNNAYYESSEQQFVFNKIEDGKNAIDQLTPYFVLSKMNGTLSNIKEQSEWLKYTKYHRSTRLY